MKTMKVMPQMIIMVSGKMTSDGSHVNGGGSVMVLVLWADFVMNQQFYPIDIRMRLMRL